MTRWWIALALTGCAQEGVGLTLLSALPEPVEGLALDGSRARAGMAGQLCDIDVGTGEVIGDEDVTNGIERVLDARDDQVLGVVDGQLFLTDAQVRTWDWPVVDGALTDDGVVALLRGTNGACQVAWGEQAVEVAELDCTGSPGFAAAPDGTVWIADGNHVGRIAPASATAWSLPADQVSWTPTGAVVGRKGARVLTGIGASGTASWTHQLDGTLDAMAPFGRDGTAIMVEQQTGGALTFLGADGETVGHHPLPGLADLTVDDGQVALGTPDGTLFYEVEDGGLFHVDQDVRPEGSGPAGTVASLTITGVVLSTALVLAD